MPADVLVGTVVPARPVTPAPDHDPARRFVVGQTLRGVVLRTLPQGQTLVNFGGQQVALDLAQPLARGQTFLASVEQTSPTLLLKVVASPTQPVLDHLAGATTAAPPDPVPPSGILTAAQLKPYLAATQPFGDVVAALQHHLGRHPWLQEMAPALLQRLEDTLTTLLPQADTAPDAAGLQAQVDRSGLSYEARVQHLLTGNVTPEAHAVLASDLKGQLLELLARLEQVEEPPSDLAEVRQHVQQALQNIERQQLANLFARQEHQALLVQLLHPALSGSHTARLYVRADAGGSGVPQGSQPGYTVVFLLDLTALGPLRIDATVHGAHLAATMSTTVATVADFLTAHTPLLVARLQELGWQAAVHCRTVPQVPVEIEDTFTRVLLADATRLLDVTA